MTAGSILACRDARATFWQLGPLPPDRGRLTLLAWRLNADTHDGGVPSEVAQILARSWSAIARVTFLSSIIGTQSASDWSPSDAGMVRAMKAGGVLGRALARARGTPGGGALVSTRSADVAAQLFEDPGFPWWLQGQIVLLSDPDATPPDVDGPTMLTLLDDDWAARAAALAAAGVHAGVRPGVDGDVAGVLALSDAFDVKLLESLEREARGAGLTWDVVAEASLSGSPLGGARR